jgi:hypothetical protein
MPNKKVVLGEMWKSDSSGEVYLVTSFCKDVFWSYVYLRGVGASSGTFRKAKLIKTELGETLDGYRVAETI